jgi:hypothetical protein
LRSSVWQRYSGVVNSGVQLWVGATCSDVNGNASIASFQAANSIIGPLQSRRTYVSEQPVSSFPTNISQTNAAADISIDIHPFLSAKGDPTGLANGDYDGVITELLQSFPTSSTSFFTMWHEPEDNMTGAQFVALFQHIYPVCKAANPNVLVGPIFSYYEWRSNNAPTATPDDWWVGSSYCDYMTIDCYWPSWRGAVPQPLENDPYFLRWHNWATTKGKTLYVTERGIAGDDTVCASVILQDETWMKANGYGMYMYWDADIQGDWILTPTANPAMVSAWQQIASRGRSS